MNADDICGELAAARQDLIVALRALNATKYDDVVERIDLAIAGIDQAVKLWSAERDYWAHVEREAAKPYVPPVPAVPAYEIEQPVVWAKRHESIHGFEDDWRSHGIA